MTAFAWLALVVMTGFAGGPQAEAQKAGPSDTDVAAISALYGEWSQALATRGVEGYASYFKSDADLECAAVLPFSGLE